MSKTIVILKPLIINVEGKGEHFAPSKDPKKPKVVDVSNDDAAYLVHMKKAVLKEDYDPKNAPKPEQKEEPKQEPAKS